MGVVIKQSFWGSVLAYIGVAIGYLNTIILRPKFLNLDQIGLLSTLISNGLLLAPLASMGMSAALVKYHPYITVDDMERKKFISYQFLLIAFSNVAIAAILVLLIGPIKKVYQTESALYNQYIYLSIIILVSQSFYTYLQSYCRVNQNVTFPTILKEIYLRIGYALAVLLFGLSIISFDLTVKILVTSYATSTVILLIYAFTAKRFYLVKLSISDIKKLFSRVSHYSFYSMFMAIGSSIYHNIGFLLIPILIGLNQNGIYSTCFYMAVLIEMPKRAFSMIISPIVSSEIKSKNFSEINSLYKRSSLSLGVLGCLLFLGIMINITDLFLLIPKGAQFAQGKHVILLISLAKLIDMVLALNTDIISYSDHYRKNLQYLIAVAVIMTIMCMVLIPVFGINGAAGSFLASTVIYNGLKNRFILKRMKLSPFSQKHVYLLIITVALGGIFMPLSILSNPLADMIVKSILISLIYLSLIYRLKISSDINSIIRVNFKKYLKISLYE